MRYESILTNPAVHALGWSLLHFLWQGALLAVALGAVNAVAGGSSGRQTTARIRYAAAVIVMLLMPVVLVITFVENYPSRTPAPNVREHFAVTTTVANVEALPAASGMTGVALPAWIVFVWSLGVLGLSARATCGWIRAQVIRRRGCEPVNPELAAVLERLRHALHVARPVRLYASVIVKAPMVVGWIRPMILLPLTAITGLTETQLRFVLAHELAHIRRHDYLVNLMQAGVETLFFYHPAVWWISRQMRTERENCCDDLAIEVCGDVAGYAHALAQLEQLRVTPEPALAANGGELLSRIRRLLEEKPSKHGVSKSMAAVVAAALGLCLIAAPSMRSQGTTSQRIVTPGIEVQVTEPSAAELQSEPPRRLVQEENHVGSGQGNGRGNGVGNGVGNGTGEIFDFDLKDLEQFNRDMKQFNRDAGLFNRGISGGIFSPFGARPGGGEPGPSAQSTDMLIKLYDGTQDIEVRRQILDYLGSSNSPQAVEKLRSVAQTATEPELRVHAIDYLAGRADPSQLISLYDQTREPEIKRHVLDYLAGSNTQQASEKMLSVARTDPDPELRRHAIDYIAGSPNAFDTLVNLYDNSRDMEIKRHVLDYIGGSSDPRALQKLFSIAQSDPDREMRRAAVDYIAGR
jgi:beta-lactamase regulating signal transducer with metallopeptidase domain